MECELCTLQCLFLQNKDLSQRCNLKKYIQRFLTAFLRAGAAILVTGYMAFEMFSSGGVQILWCPNTSVSQDHVISIKCTRI